METFPTTMVNGSMLLGGVILIASIGFEVNRYIATNFITFFINMSKQAATQSPGRYRPRQRGGLLIVMFSR